ARVPVGDSAILVRDRRLGGRWISRILLDSADEIERSVKRLVVLRIRRDIGLRAGLLVAFGLEVSAQRSLAARVGTRFELLRHLLQHLNVGRDTLRLYRASGRGEVARGGQPERPIAGAEGNDGLHRAFSERARADHGRTPVILERACHNFGGRGRTAVDQHDDRLVLGEIAGARIEALGLLGVAAARRYDLTLLQEGIRDRNRLIQGAFSIRYCNAAQAMNASAAMTHKLSPSVSTSFSRRTSLSRSHCSILSANFPAEDVDACLDM